MAPASPPHLPQPRFANWLELLVRLHRFEMRCARLYLKWVVAAVPSERTQHARSARAECGCVGLRGRASKDERPRPASSVRHGPLARMSDGFGVSDVNTRSIHAQRPAPLGVHAM